MTTAEEKRLKKEKKEKKRERKEKKETSEEKQLRKKRKREDAKPAEEVELKPLDSRKKSKKNDPSSSDSDSENKEPSTQMTPVKYLLENNIRVLGFEGGQVPTPVLSFDAAPFPKAMLAPLLETGFAAPSPIQAMAWPIVSSGDGGRDCIAVAKTGSGKTLGFLLPAFAHLATVRPAYGSSRQRGDPPRVLVLAPTRELAVQIQDESTKFGTTSRVRTSCVYGGAPKFHQIRALQAGLDILVATPGRLNDLVEMGKVDLSQVSFLVFDEADRMLDMGFEPQIRQILDFVPAKRLTLFFTATWPKSVQKLAATFLNNPAQINIGATDVLQASKSITQTIYVLGGAREKWTKLEEVLGTLPGDAKTLIFSATKRGCNQVADDLWKKGVAVDSIHGDKQQWERTKVLESFRSGALSILVATDVAARGLDVKGISHVINYDFPAGTGAVEDYVHRIGRTGRGSATGAAITFFTNTEAKHARELCDVMRRADQNVPPELEAMSSRRGGGGGKGRWGGGGKGGGRRSGGWGGRGGGGGRSYGGGKGRR